jgi:uncharacterized protein (DUF1778 family)
MPRAAVEENSRMSLRIRGKEKAILMRAVALEDTDLTGFVVGCAVRAAKDVIRKSEQLQLSERDSLKVLELLENPPLPNAKLVSAARAFAEQSRQ